MQPKNTSNDVALISETLQLRNRDADPSRVYVRVGDRANDRRGLQHLNAYRLLVFNQISAGDVALCLRTVADLDSEILKVQAPVRVLDWGVVQVDRLQAVLQALDLALADQVKHAGILRAVEVVAGLGGGALLATAAAATLAATSAATTSADNLVHAATCTVSMPAEITTEPTSVSP